MSTTTYEFVDHDQDINTILTYYIASLPEAVGKRYRPPSLDFLVKFWFDSNCKEVLFEFLTN